MSITSHAFLLLFLPLSLLAYYACLRSSRQKMFFLLALSYLFYALAGLKFVPLLLGLSLATFLSGKWGKAAWAIGLNLAALLLFKYWNFGIENANSVLSALGIQHSLGLLKLGMPLGLSFFVFKHIGYLLDLKQNRYPPAPDFWTFATFSAYFPQISSGPISNFNETASQFEALPHRPSREQLASGLIYVSYGLAKKILIADTIGGLLASPVNRMSGFSGLFPAWYIVIAYAIQLYFDFSGYTDLVLGASTLFGIRLPQNFNSPYLANNAMEFWERWHISLSSWFRNYLFFPLSRTFLRKWGSERRQPAQYAANLISMTLIGLWHGAGWNFILWGFYHGLLLNLTAWQKRINLSLPMLVQKSLFLILVLFGWALFMSDNVSYMQYLFGQLIGLGGLGSLQLISQLFRDDTTLVLIFAIPIAFSGISEAAAIEPAVQKNAGRLALLGSLAAICIILIETARSFIYIKF